MTDDTALPPTLHLRSSELERLEEAIECFHALEEQLARAKQAINEAVVGLAEATPGPASRQNLANHLYWFVPEVNANTIAQAFGGDSFGKLR